VLEQASSASIRFVDRFAVGVEQLPELLARVELLAGLILLCACLEP
jgi:hypothetical protein